MTTAASSGSGMDRPEEGGAAERGLPGDFYRAIVERAPILVAVATADKSKRWMSPAARRILGGQPGVHLAEAIPDIVHPADREAAFATLAGPASYDEPIEMRLRSVEGDYRAVSVVAADLRDQPPVNGVVYYGIDVTRARAAEHRERVEATRLHTLVDSLAVGVLVLDDEHRVLMANPTLADMFDLGAAPAELTGQRLLAPAPPTVNSAGWKSLADVVTDACPDTVEATLPSGRVIERICTPITVDDAPGGQLWVVRDVTSAVAARRALEEHNQRLAALSALKSEFIAIVSHELRTPLTSISAFTEMLGGPGELTSQDAPDAVAAIARNTDRMLVLVQDLKILSQLETGDHPVASGVVDLTDLVRELGDGIETAGRVVNLRAELGSGPMVDGDEQLLRQLVHTVVGVVAACAAGDEMVLRAGADETGWTLCATAPSGEFVTDEQLLATPLPVLDDASRQRSAALSVLLARAIAHSHGGSLVTKVSPGATATVTVRLPVGRH